MDFCNGCNTRLIGDESFCPACGRKLEGDADVLSSLTGQLDNGKKHDTSLRKRKLVILLTSLALIFFAGFIILNNYSSPGRKGNLYEDSITDGEFITVNSTEDSGKGTLRDAIINAQPGDAIVFDQDLFPPENPATIYLVDQLPDLSQGNITINASNAGVILDGSSISSSEQNWISGLNINSNDNVVQGLQIVNFSYACGIFVGDFAINNLIGGDRNTGIGPVGQGNLIGNVNTGIALQGIGSLSNKVEGNIIGIDLSGYKAWTVVGVHILEGAKNNIIGPNNIIVNSDNCGIQVWGSTTYGNTLTQNSIYNNAWLGIELWEGGNMKLDPPIITFYDLNNGIVEGKAKPGSVVELFSDSEKQGKYFEGDTEADDNGYFTFHADGPIMGPSITATATDFEGNTSEFCAPFGR